MQEQKKEYLSGIIFLALGICTCIVAVGIPNPEGSETGPSFFPKVIGISMIVLSGILIIKTWIASKNHKLSKETEATNSDSLDAFNEDEKRAFLIAGICLLYALLFSKLGYFLSTFISIALIGALFKEKRVWVYLVLCLISVAIWAGFTYLLGINLP